MDAMSFTIQWKAPSMNKLVSRRDFVRALAGASVIAGSAKSISGQERLFYPEWINNYVVEAALSEADASLVTPYRQGSLDPQARYFNHYMCVMEQFRAAGLDRLMASVADYPEIWPQLQAMGYVDWDLIDQGLTPYLSPASKQVVMDSFYQGVTSGYGQEASMLSYLRDGLGIPNLHNAAAAGVLRSYTDTFGGTATFPCYNPPWWNPDQGWWWYDPWDIQNTPQPQSPDGSGNPFLQMSKADICFWANMAQYYLGIVGAVLTKGPNLGFGPAAVTIVPLISPHGAAVLLVTWVAFTGLRMIFCT
jgi:hypothetical protein